MKRITFTLVAVVLFVVSFDAHAIDMTWTNTAGGDYLVAGNWSPAGPPGASDKAILDGIPSGAIVLSGNVTHLSLQGAANSGPITLDLGGKVLELLNYNSSTPYANWGFTCLENTSLTVTNSTSGGKIDGLGGAKADSSALFIDSGAALTVSGSDTALELLQARIAAGGFLNISGGAAVALGSSGVYGASDYYGNDPDDIALVVDGAGSTYWDVVPTILNCTMVVTNGGSAYSYRTTTVGSSGLTGKVLVSGAGSRMYGHSINIGSANSTGVFTVNQGGRLEIGPTIGCANNAAGQVFVSGTGSQVGTSGGGYLRICDGNYTGASGLLEVTDGALASYRRLYMGKGGVVRLGDTGTLQLTWGSADLSRLTYNYGGSVEGTGIIKNTANNGIERFENDDGGMIAPGSPIGTLTMKGWGSTVSGTGAFTNGPTGMMEFEIASETSYDRLVFENSNFHLGGGTLTVTLLDDFQPSIGDTFQLLDFDPDRQSGTFEFVLLPFLGAGIQWTTENLYVDGSISVIEKEERDPTTFTWNYIDGGDYAIANFWTPEGGPPTLKDGVVLTGLLPSPIVVDMARSVDTFSVSNAAVTLDLNGYDYRIMNDASGVPYDAWGITCQPDSVFTLKNSGVSLAKFGGLGTAEDGSPNLFLAADSKMTLSSNVQASVLSARIASGAVLELDDGTLKITSSNGVKIVGVTLTGKGRIESVATAASAFVNQGQIVPGSDGSGILTLAGFNSVSNAPDSEIVIQVRSSMAEASYGRLDVTDGNLALGGTLRISLDIYNRLPTNGAVYNVLDWNTVSGTFDAIVLPHWGTWSTDDLYIDGTISSAPYVATPDLAEIYVWTNTVVGDYMDGANWDPYGPPGTNDTARLSGNTSPLVYLSDIRLTNATLQADGGPVTLDLNGLPLRLSNFYSGTTYTNWGFACLPGSRLTVTNSTTVAKIGTLGTNAANSSALFIDEAAVLTLSGENTKLVGAAARTRGGLLRIENGADVVFGSDPVRQNCYYRGSDTNAITPFVIVDGPGSTYYCTTASLDDGCFVVTNSGSFHSYRGVNIGTAGGTRGGFRCTGSGSSSYFQSMDIANGYLRIERGGTADAAPVIGSGVNSSGEVIVTGADSLFNCGFLYMGRNATTESYSGSTGTLHVANGGYAKIRFVRMQTNAVIRLDQGNIDFTYGLYENRSIMQGGRVEGIGMIRHTSSDRWFENLGGVIAPGLPVGTLTFANYDHLVNGSGGTIAFQIAGDEADAYGCLALSDSTLELGGGTLQIALADGYKPTRRTTYQIFDLSLGGRVTGSFDTVELPKYGDWLLDELYTNGTVTVNPATGTVVIIR